MITFFSADFASFLLRRSLPLSAMLCMLGCVSSCLAQHHSGHSHSYGSGGGHQHGGGGYNNPGILVGTGLYGGAYNYGGFNASGPLGGFNASGPLGGVSFGNASGTATYSQRNFGVTTYGLSNSGFGGINYGVREVGYGAPVFWSAPAYNCSPSAFGYGNGVISPNFFYGNSISNGYLGFGLPGVYDPWCQPGWPYVIGTNSYFPGTGIAPTVLMLNMNLSMLPVMPFENSSALIDPRAIDQLAPAVNPDAPAPDRTERAPVPQPPQPGDEPLLPQAPQLPGQPDDVPVLNEFNPVPRDQKVSSLTDRIHSLRYQASGDDAFRKSDYPTADVFYATAIRTAPDRRAPYLRMAMVRIALADFPSAASYLKAGLMMESDASRPWCTAEELYGEKVAERARTHGGPLWNWLAERPMSADRLLLAGTFQKLRGYNKTADEMLALASHDGAEALLVSEVTHLAATDVGQRPVSHDLERLLEQASAQNETSAAPVSNSSRKRAVEQAGGIFMRGGLAAAQKVSPVASPKSRPPAPADAVTTEPVPFEIPNTEGN